MPSESQRLKSILDSYSTRLGKYTQKHYNLKKYVFLIKLKYKFI